MSERLASGPQLWRLNQAGWLLIADESVTPIYAPEAFELVSKVVIGEPLDTVASTTDTHREKV